MAIKSIIRTTPLAPTFGAELSGLDFSKPLNDADFAAVRKSMEDYGVIVLRATNFTDQSLIAFGRRFGKPDVSTPHISPDAPARLPHVPEIFDISNINVHNQVVTEKQPKKVAIAKANQLWHADGQYNPLRTSWSMLRAVEIPPKGTGGETEYLDARAAFDDLPKDMQERVKGLVGLNNMHTRVKEANPDMPEYANLNPLDYPFARHKIASLHEATGRWTLYLSSYTYHIEGLPIEDGQNLLKELFSHLKQDKYQLTIEWEHPGDVVLWDNTSVLHRATGGSYEGKYRRDMRRVSILDNSTEAFGLNSKEDMWRQGAP